MNTECRRNASELTSTINGEAWYGDSLREILDGVTAGQAREHPIANAHSIWEIVLHLDAWIRLYAGAIRGIPIPLWSTMPKEQDWPPLNATDDEAWEACVRSVFDNHLDVAKAIENFGDDRLVSTVPGRAYNFSQLFRSASLHAAYHAGQIALLKKMLK
jgi:hypothetical protein